LATAPRNSEAALIAEHIIAARAVSPEVAQRCFDVIARCEKQATDMGVDMRGGQPTPGNIEGARTSAIEVRQK